MLYLGLNCSFIKFIMKNITKIVAVVVAVLFGLNVYSQNHPPTAVPDTVYVTAGSRHTLFPLENDYDIDGDKFRILGAYATSDFGTVIRNNDTSIFVNIDIISAGLDSVHYLIRDVNGGYTFGYVLLFIDNDNATDTLNANNVSAIFAPFGNLFRDFSFSVKYNIPADSSTGTIYVLEPWIGGLDVNGDLHIAGDIHRNMVTDFYAGPVRDTSIQTSSQDSIWNRVWKVTKDEISFHRNNYYFSGYSPIESIASWPAHGNTSLGQAQNLAPFVDVDNNGIYNPMNGDYPNIKGDQSVYIIFNDSRSKHYETGGLPLGVEIHEMAYAYSCSLDEALSNTIFIHYDVINRSNNTYSDTYFGLFTDTDIGYCSDDYIGCDTIRNTYFGYNAGMIDGTGLPNYYGANPPAQAVTSLSDNMDRFISYVVGYSSNSKLPDQTSEYYLNMKGIWSDSTYITVGGNGHNPGGAVTNFIYPGDPTAISQWTEGAVNNMPGDRAGLASFGPFTFSPSSTISYDFALIYSRANYGGNSVAKLQDNIDLIQSYFDNDSTPCGGSFTAVDDNIKKNVAVKVYPNPVENNLIIEYMPNNSNASYKFISLSSQVIKNGILEKNDIHSVDVTHVSPGFYFLIITDGEFNSVNKVIVK